MLIDPLRVQKYLWWTVSERAPRAALAYLARHKAKRRRFAIVSVNSKETGKRALLDYIVEPFLGEMEGEAYRSHANFWKAETIVQTLIEFGYQVDVTDWRNMHAPRAENYDLVIGQARAFNASCRLSRKRIPKIFLGWGPHASVAAQAVRSRVTALQKRRGIKLAEFHPKWHNATRWATHVFYIGDDWVGETYRRRTRLPCFSLPNPVTGGVRETTERKDFESARNHFMWLAGYGPLRRGLDLLLEFFERHPDKHLWVCGNLIDSEKHFFKVYERELLEVPNIHYVGWVDVASEEFAELTQKCGFLLYPSVSDGMPGSVVNSMAAGVVPVLSPGAGMDGGIRIAGVDEQELEKAINECSRMSPAELKQRSTDAVETIRRGHQRENFRAAFTANLGAVLADYDDTTPRTTTSAWPRNSDPQ